MSAQYVTREGDTIDMICWDYYGATSGAVEKVIEANKGLEDQPEILPAGVTIELPDITIQAQGKKPVRLWD